MKLPGREVGDDLTPEEEAARKRASEMSREIAEAAKARVAAETPGLAKAKRKKPEGPGLDAAAAEARTRKWYAFVALLVSVGILALSVWGAHSAYRDAHALAQCGKALDDGQVRVFLGGLAVKAVVGAALAFLAVRLLGAAERMLVPMRFIFDNPDMVRALTGRDARVPHAGTRSLVDPSDDAMADVEKEAASK